MRSVVVILVLLASAFKVQAAPGVKVFQCPTDKAITEGETIIDGDAADVYAQVLDYAKWKDIFPDISRVVITAKHGEDARVTLIKPDGNKDNLHFHNQSQARMVYFEDTGNHHADVWAEIVFIPGDEAGTTRVHVRLYADVHGIASVVVSDGDVRRQRETRVERDLAGIRNYFRRR